MCQIDPWSLNEGDIFYECAMGLNFEFVADKVERTEEKVRWRGLGKDNTFTDFLVTKGFEPYGPKIYSEPQYARNVDGMVVFDIK